MSEPSFAADIRPLFRESDVAAMSSFFDLSSYADVVEHADAIYERLEDGSMPCDGGWPEDKVATFKSWLDVGKPA